MFFSKKLFIILVLCSSVFIYPMENTNFDSYLKNEKKNLDPDLLLAELVKGTNSCDLKALADNFFKVSKSKNLFKNSEQFFSTLLIKLICLKQSIEEEENLQIKLNGITRLIKAGVDINLKNEDGDLDFDWFVLFVLNDGLLKALSARPAKDKFTYGLTPLIWACALGYIDVVKLLIANGANPNIQDFYGTTALMCACKFGHLEVVKLLIDAKANLDLRSKNSQSAYEYAYWATSSLDYYSSMKTPHNAIMKLLAEEGADQKIKNSICNIV